MATWHQSRNKAGNAALHSPPAKGYKVVIDPWGGFAYSIGFTRKRDAKRYVSHMADKRGVYIISSKGERL